jgi:hypothetical protein
VWRLGRDSVLYVRNHVGKDEARRAGVKGERHGFTRRLQEQGEARGDPSVKHSGSMSTNMFSLLKDIRERENKRSLENESWLQPNMKKVEYEAP